MMRSIFVAIFVFTLASTRAANEETDVPLVTAPSGEYKLEWILPAGPLRSISAKNSSDTTDLAVPALVRVSGVGPMMDEIMPLPFISPDSEWIFIPSRDKVYVSTGFEYFEGAAILFHRIRSNDGAIHFEPALGGRFDQAAWEFLAEELKLKRAEMTADAHRVYSADFIDWSQDSGRLLMAVAGGVWSAKDGWLEASAYHWYCYFNTRSGKFELTDRLRAADNRPERNEPTKDEAAALAAVVTNAESIGQEGPQKSPKEHFDEADKRLNEIYKELIAKTEPAKRLNLRDEEREWIQSRDTEAKIAAIQVWSSGREADARILESKALSTEARIVDLQQRLEKK
jgi:uncharacterized protein YecT (DUF1311 family)